ncbi:exopolysaccharide biosynthesis polyprenyl glycosylphosphotransferase [Candidatus Nitrospira bockiana]
MGIAVEYGKVLEFRRRAAVRSAWHRERMDGTGAVARHPGSSAVTTSWIPVRASRGPAGVRRLLILGAGPLADDLVEAVKRRPGCGYEVAGCLDFDVALEQAAGKKPRHRNRVIQEILEHERIECVVTATPEQTEALSVDEFLEWKAAGIDVRDGADLYEALTKRVCLEALRPSTFVHAERRTRAVDRGKRGLDLVLVLLCVLCALPLFVILPLLIKLTSPGPVLYRQTRAGLHGRPFTMLKFRSMVAEAEAGGTALWAREADPRVTPVGAVMRRFRMDELPQLWNILKGEMSFIGPRPERPEFLERLQTATPWYGLRHSVKPGLTGWAQVRFRYGATVEDAIEKLTYDLYYVKRRSLLLDCRIVLKTVGVVLRGIGAR